MPPPVVEQWGEHSTADLPGTQGYLWKEMVVLPRFEERSNTKRHKIDTQKLQKCPEINSFAIVRKVLMGFSRAKETLICTNLR